ncbi:MULTISPECIES: bifunctional serine/threonine-protein kinase/ABC transporter substrate-binding protein [unclassified Streptomyces]|uniref:bifunctional serine/threonine-protein kinase/ABC transporter substrate-binding protein n=1 Tax=unclassified Streptomyces TaxID=2593676 RepID=UPI000F6F4B2F|nr:MULTISPECIES: bifunctional serine/threonine-protein kinase/ABC transporter substrate-binding protein [unclassified Streptomyces]AZM64020.1 serine/threonine protein kinase [Streptomyces sp. WAC 01438]RSM88109.1 serine/threonine protein kinase [Streptomyces sp. WAC 01420]
MERLRPSDPSETGGHRLIGRRGRHGRGLPGASPHGGWCALKVIRGEHTADPGFRARFRREAELAARLGGRWTVPVLAADAEAASPWLATAYVAGPSLAEAVAREGPWGERHLVALGAALAEALDDVHTAGLVHRDVKPANVLLTADGPRLIDFGIARSVGATALTADGSVVGSSGHLSPEQARGRTAGPASDVFSLGCVLAHAATGRAVFGGGPAAGVLYRTVHEEPDLDGTPPGPEPIVRHCLAKEPEARPAVGELRALFGEFEADDGLPAGPPGLIAAQAARIVALPVPEPTVTGAEPAGPQPARPSPTRRRLLVGGAALGAGTAAAAAWWLGSRDATGQSGSAARPRSAVGLLGRSGDGVVTAHERGARLAVEQHNGAAGRPFDLVLRTADDRGTAEGAAAAAARLAAPPDLAVAIGAGTNATVLAAVEACARARVTLVLTRADTHRLDSVTRTTALLLRLTRTAGPPAILRHLNRVVKPGRTVIVHDLSDAAETAASVRIVTVYGKLDGETAVEEVPAGGDFADVVRRIAVRPRDAVMFAGVRSARAAAFARALAGRGHRGARVAGEHVLGARFLAEAEGWMIGTGYADAGADPRLRSFAAAHRDRYGRSPAPWAAEAYDAVRFAAHGLAAAGDDGPAALRSELPRRPWQGITRRIAYHAGGQFYDTDGDGGAFRYRVTDGATRFVARADDIDREA